MKVAVAAPVVFLLIFPLEAQDPALSPAGTPLQDPAVSSADAPIKDPAGYPGDTITVIGTGDIMLGTDYPSISYLPPGGDCTPLLRPVLEVLRSGDLLFGNLEGVFCAEGGTPKYCRDTTRCYVFRMPDHFVNCLVEAGYDVLSVANNHVNDFGPRGRITTARVLTEAGIAFAGFTTHPRVIFEKKGITYGFAAFSPHTGTMDLKNYGEAARITRMLDSIADIVIISFHGGAEGKEYQHVVRGDEEYLGYNRGNTHLFAHTVVDAGADVVFGHGPHVTRAMELYRGRLICYSLGNFCTYRRFNLTGPNGIAPIVKVRMDRRGNFISGEVIPVYQPGEGGPRIDPRGRVIDTLQALTDTDFPDRLLAIGPDGAIVPPLQMARVEVLGGISTDGVPGADVREWAPERLEMVWTHFLGETVSSGKRASHSRNRVGWTARPLLFSEGKDTFLVQGFDHHLKKLNASTGELIWEYSPGDSLPGTGLPGTRAISYFTGEELPAEEGVLLFSGSGMSGIEMATGEVALIFSDSARMEREGNMAVRVGVNNRPDTCHLAAYTDMDGVLHVVRHNPAAGQRETGPDSQVAAPCSPGSEPATGPPAAQDSVAPDHREVFSWRVESSVSRPLFTGERLVVCSDNGIYLFGYDRNMNFELLDRLPVPVEITPVICGGKLFVASLNGYLYCLGEKD